MASSTAATTTAVSSVTAAQTLNEVAPVVGNLKDKPVLDVTNQAKAKEAPKGPAKPYCDDWKNDMIAVAGVILTLGAIFFLLTAAGVLPFKAVMLGGVPAAAALAFATGVAAIIAFICRYSCNPNDKKGSVQSTATSPKVVEEPTQPIDTKTDAVKSTTVSVSTGPANDPKLVVV